MAVGPELILFYVALIVVCGKIGGELAERFKQPAVLGELLVGILIGPSLLGLVPTFNILSDAEHEVDEARMAPGNETALQDTGRFFLDHFETVGNLEILAALATLGVLVLLFEVGLESSLRDFTRVGPSASVVAVIGIVLSFLIGYGASIGFAQYYDWIVTDRAASDPNILHIFIGATLTATSVGITARVLGDMGKIRSKEAQVILGAAVLDDVLALIILGVVSGLAAGGGITLLGVGKIFAIAIGFFVGSIAIGVLVMPRALEWTTKKFKSHGVPLAFAFSLMVIMAYLASLVNLDPIVGAFAGGLILSQSPHKHVIFDQLKPLGTIFISFFFVTLGARVDLTSITTDTMVPVVVISLGLTVAGILGKLACGWGVVQKGVHRMSVGVGMVPRGEVGLIFALIGLELGLLANWQYATVIIVVMLTTLVTPIWLKSYKEKIGTEPSSMPSLARTGELVEP